MYAIYKLAGLYGNISPEATERQGDQPKDLFYNIYFQLKQIKLCVNFPFQNKAKSAAIQIVGMSRFPPTPN